MSVRCPYVTEYRRSRDRVYVVRMRLAVSGAVLLHLVLILVLAPFRQQIPLVRHIGYEGPVRLLPEISVRGDVSEQETEKRQAQGLGSESFFEVVDTRLVPIEEAVDDEPRRETGDYDEDYGEELLRLLEHALPQPTNRDVVIVKFVKPVYPPLSIAEGREGVVEFRMHVTSRGRVARVWLLSSDVDERMEVAARRALMQWRFRPYISNGLAVGVLVDQRVRFQLNEATGGVTVRPGLR